METKTKSTKVTKVTKREMNPKERKKVAGGVGSCCGSFVRKQDVWDSMYFTGGCGWCEHYKARYSGSTYIGFACELGN